MSQLSEVNTRPGFDTLLRSVLDITAGCTRDQLMEIADRLHERRRAMVSSDGRRDDGLAIH